METSVLQLWWGEPRMREGERAQCPPHATWMRGCRAPEIPSVGLGTSASSHFWSKHQKRQCNGQWAIRTSTTRSGISITSPHATDAGADRWRISNLVFEIINACSRPTRGAPVGGDREWDAHRVHDGRSGQQSRFMNCTRGGGASVGIARVPGRDPDGMCLAEAHVPREPGSVTTRTSSGFVESRCTSRCGNAITMPAWRKRSSTWNRTSLST
jgi:hypothetical protein